MSMSVSDGDRPPKPLGGLRGRVAMVTGGSSGIGGAIARALGRAGADVAIGARHAVGSACARALAEDGTRSIALDVNVRSTQAMARFHATAVEALGPIDILVNAAGVCHHQPMCGHDEEAWLETIDVNLNGVYRAIRLCLPAMIARRWGRVINIASDIALVGMAEYPAYCASKAAVAILTRCAALEGAAHGVCCNTISPGWVDTEMARRAIAAAETAEPPSGTSSRFDGRGARPKMILPKDVAALAVFLCGDEAACITMQDVTVSAAGQWYREARRTN
jgi:NAD(P)-dependent dehydrogenase (short-subunit alcohol dehydrogenase family)